MGRRASNNPRQLREQGCGCQLCMEKYPPEEYGDRRRRRDCTGAWQARYRTPDGKQKAKNFPIKDGGKKAAEAFLDKTRTNVRERTYGDPKRGEITVAQWWEVWWEAQPGRATTTTNRKLSNWNAHIKPKWGAWRLCDLEHIELQAWITREVKGYHTRKKVQEVLNQMLKAAVKDGRRIPFNPAADLDIGEAPAKHPDDLRPPSREQVALIIEHLPVYYRPLVTFLEHTGMRWGEATGLRWENVDLEAQHLKVKEVLSEDDGKLFRKTAPKSVAGFRTVPVTPQAADAIRTMAARWRPLETVTPIGDDPYDLASAELVFRGPQGGVLTRHNFRRVWVPAIQEAGLARQVKNPETGRLEWWPHVHSLRHVFATWLKDLGIPEKDAQAVLGHERGSKVTWIYQHAPEDVAAQVRARMAPETEGVRTLRAV
ncbi:site-specific integrase [Streptomyces europaeiscabiei]|uniref:tyrosine-type recombinase/integrase n=1 Tax=Streptomyces europaeiscabiei TaxID=146819 RepID=UPI0029B7708B|nr:site-specific integrase [Streptomyces europaeiscabiei]MDX3634361.1 site-specific integrase [Streptomyces europaeiscabiei]MDX3651791.1 site-specific integrase [Streptomyces europaeiscabiei]